VSAKIGFDEGDARNIFAGSDFLLMPSRFEPCGLSQMYAQKFGSLPVAHRVGGLADTIEEGRTGFLFTEPSQRSFFGAIGRALSTFGSKRHLNVMRTHAMNTITSWKRSASDYNDLYLRVCGNNAPV
jgi:starch synthase